MSSDERTYSMSEIRERRRALEQRLALQQRHLEALAEMDEAAKKLEQVEREMEALDRGESQPIPPAEGVPDGPQTTGERMLAVLKEHPGKRMSPRNILGGMRAHGWLVDTDDETALQRLRHSIRRIADRNPQVERTGDGTTYFYRYVTPGSDAPRPAMRRLPVTQPATTALPAHNGRPRDD